MENIYATKWYSILTNSGDSHGHKLCSSYSWLIFILLWEGFYVNLQKSKRFDIIDKFNDTFRYLDDVFTIDNPEFSKHIPDFMQQDSSWIKEMTSFLHLVIGSNIHIWVNDTRDESLTQSSTVILSTN